MRFEKKGDKIKRSPLEWAPLDKALEHLEELKMDPTVKGVLATLLKRMG